MADQTTTVIRLLHIETSSTRPSICSTTTTTTSSILVDDSTPHLINSLTTIISSRPSSLPSLRPESHTIRPFLQCHRPNHHYRNGHHDDRLSKKPIVATPSSIPCAARCHCERSLVGVQIRAGASEDQGSDPPWAHRARSLFNRPFDEYKHAHKSDFPLRIIVKHPPLAY